MFFDEGGCNKYYRFLLNILNVLNWNYKIVHGGFYSMWNHY